MDNEFVKISQTNHKRLSSSLSKVGYSDGISDGRESAFQKGFDEGYSSGLKIGFHISALKIFANYVKTNNDIFKNEDLYEEVKNFLDWESKGNAEINLDVISKVDLEERKIANNNLLKKLEQDFPLLHSFISIK